MDYEDQIELTKEYIEEAAAFLDELEGRLLKMEKGMGEAPDPVLLNEILGLLHTFKGTSGMMCFTSLQRYAHKLEDLFKALQSGDLELDADLPQCCLQSDSIVRNAIANLSDVIENAFSSLGKDPIPFPKHLPPKYPTAKPKRDSFQSGEEEAPLMYIPYPDVEFPTLAEYREKTEKKYLQMLLEKAGGDRDKACQLSGISQSRLYGLLKKYNLPRFNV